MTPKEKALDLIATYRYILSLPNAPLGDNKDAITKQCALIAVDEIILSAPFEPADTDWDEAGASAQYWYPQKLEDSAKWWAEVKQEIEKL